MPFELASRTLAQLINYGSYDSNGDQDIEPTDCNYFIAQVASDDEQTTSICDQYPLSDLVNVRTFIDGTWSGNPTTMSLNTGLDPD
jgi:hypothetical protein